MLVGLVYVLRFLGYWGLVSMVVIIILLEPRPMPLSSPKRLVITLSLSPREAWLVRALWRIGVAAFVYPRAWRGWSERCGALVFGLCCTPTCGVVGPSAAAHRCFNFVVPPRAAWLVRALRRIGVRAQFWIF